MGWLQISRKAPAEPTQGSPKQHVKIDIHHVENVGKHDVQQGNHIGSDSPLKYRLLKYPFALETTSDQDLPFISKTEVEKRKRTECRSIDLSEEKKEMWIVVDKVIYDCTDFITEHPGGEQVILSFLGEDCSWQFWRFHSQELMEQYGKKLRVGRTEGVVNRFVERAKYIGLSSLSKDEW